ncbi:DUF1259 domain-containing protein [Actinomadura sp. RB99]|uniref:DUF1259 domain-containing protein n=1 Tax=Actinomadura sp. RB99 TaxID=2691577 RepID=UPI001685F768
MGRAIGTPLRPQGRGVHTATWLRTDLRVANAGIRLSPGMDLGADAAFLQSTPGKVGVIGEAALTGGELSKVTDCLQRGNVEIAAIHKHLQDESPRLWWLHYAAYGDPVAIARTICAALALTSIPSQHQQAPTDLNAAALDHIIGAEGENVNGTYHFRVPAPEKISYPRAHRPASADAGLYPPDVPVAGRRPSRGQWGLHHDLRPGQRRNLSAARASHPDPSFTSTC